jgi:tetratricopeptide (TPR) repeat protein
VTRARPDFAPGWFALALAARRAGRCADAIPAYRRYAELQPADAEPYFGLGLCLRDTGQRAAAVTALQRFVALERRPGQEKWLEAARSLIAGLEPAAVSAPAVGAAGTSAGTGTAPPPLPPLPIAGGTAGVKASTGATTTTNSTTTGSTTTSRSTSRSTSGSTATATATGTGTGKGNGAYQEAQRLRDTGKVEAALKKFGEVVALDPDLIAARAAWGELLIKIHREGEAIGVLRAAVERNPDYPLAWYELAFALRETGRFAEAVEAYRRYIALRPGDPDPHYGVARALQKLGRDDEAARSFAAYVAMENRPGEERWITSARAELAALNQRGATRARGTAPLAPAPATSTTPADRAPAPPR